MTVRPDDIPYWSESGTAVSPTGQRRLLGWVLQSVIPYEALNWAWRYFGRWAGHVAHHTSTFDSLADALSTSALAPLDVGDTCFVDEGFNPTRLPGEIVAVYDPDGYAVSSRIPLAADTDGAYIYLALRRAGAPGVGDTWVLRRMLRDGTLDGSWSATTAGVITAALEAADVWTDGGQIFFATDTRLECFAMSGGSPVWTITLTSDTVHRITADATRVYVTNADSVKAVLRSDGSSVYVYDHGGHVHDVTVDNQTLYLIGCPSGHTSGATMRRIWAETGADVAGEGGLGTDLTGLTWDAVQAVTTSTSVLTRGAIALGKGGEVFTFYREDGGTDDVLTRLDPVSGGLYYTRTNVGGYDIESGYPTVQPYDLSVDQDTVWGCKAGSGSIAAFSYEGVASSLQLPVLSGPPRVVVGNVISDGAYVWCYGVAVDVSGPTTVGTVAKVSRRSRVELWRRVDPSGGVTLPLRQPLVPVG